MMDHFGTIMFTEPVKEAQKTAGSRAGYAEYVSRPAPEGLGPDEQAFIETRRSIYLATANADGWPYVQHRGGPPGFLKCLGPTEIGFTEQNGNRQFITKGNLEQNNRIALFLMDYPRQTRLKIIGYGQLDQGPDGAAHMRITVAAFDWNCPKFITPRYDEAEIATMLGAHIRSLEAENAALKSQIAALQSGPKP